MSSINFNKFISQATTTKNSGIDFNKFITNKVITPTKTFKLNESLGGGEFNVGKSGELVKTDRGYAGIEAPGQYREHIFPVALGGTSNVDNIKVYGKDIGAKKSAYENEIIKQYKAGKLSLAEAQGLILKKFRELTGIDQPTSILGNFWGGVKDTFAQTTQAVKDIVSSVKSEKEKLVTPSSTPQMAVSLVKNYAKSIYETDKEEIQRVKDLFSKTQTKSEKVSQGLKVITGGVGVALSPITALFEAPKDIPILGTLSKIATLPFAVAGDIGSTEFKEALDMLPLDKKTKTTLNDAVGEIGALAGQIALGGQGFKKGKEFLTKKKELVKKFGEKDAETIIKKAEEKAVVKPEITEAPKIDFNKFIPKEEVRVEEPLLQEAKKYKSAEEFVKAQGTPVYRGISNGEIVFEPSAFGSLRDYGFSVSKNKNVAKRFGGEYVDEFGVTQNKLIEGNILPNAKIKKVGELSGSDVENEIKLAIKEGYDGLEFKNYDSDVNKFIDEITIFNKDVIKTKSQLIDIWNKAQETTEKMYKPSGVAINIEAKAIEQGMLKKGYKELAEYDSSTIKEQADLASKYDVKELNKIARGDAPLPRELKPGTVLSIAEDYAKKNQDINLMRELARSPLVSKISESASEVSLSRMREKGTMFEAMREVIKARQESYKAKTGREYIKDEVAEVKKMKEEIKRSSPKKDEWLSFLDEIKCK